MISNNPISDIRPIAGFNYLELGSNQISDISPLGQWGGSSALLDINLDLNKITDLAPLLSITKYDLFEVEVRKNPIDCTV